MSADTFDRIDYAQAVATEAGLTAEQIGSMLAYTLGAVLTHFDESPPVPMTDSRWRRIVRDAVANSDR